MKDREAKLNQRRRLLSAIAAGVGTIAYGALGRAAGVLGADVPNSSFAVTTINHLSYASENYKVTRDFYVDLLGMRNVWDDGLKCQLDCGPEDAPNSFYLAAAKPGTAPTVAHFFRRISLNVHAGGTNQPL